MELSIGLSTAVSARYVVITRDLATSRTVGYFYENRKATVVSPAPVDSDHRSLGTCESSDAELQSWTTSFKEHVDPATFASKLTEYATGRFVDPEFLDAWLRGDVVNKQMKPCKSPSVELAQNNCVYVNPRDYYTLSTRSGAFVELNGFVWTMLPNDSIAVGRIGLNDTQRRTAQVGLNYAVDVKAFSFPHPTEDFHIGSFNVEVDFRIHSSRERSSKFKIAELETFIREVFGGQVFQVGQRFLAHVPGTADDIVFTVKELRRFDQRQLAAMAGVDAPADVTEESLVISSGQLRSQSEILILKAGGSNIVLEGVSNARRTLFNPSWNFEDMGIGGLDDEFSAIFRRAFASRLMSPRLLEKLGVQHVKGMLLFGPPGTGKTLIARQIGKMLVGKEPKVVNGPEILNKYVGASEENIRKLFEEAEADYAQNGENAELHIIIFDEIDAICKTRGSSRDSTGVHDTVVNQLLAMIDGVNSLNNILVIGMTNRKDMIDEALLRPGRLEVQIEIGLPDSNGRQQILRIHTKRLRSAGFLDFAGLAIEDGLLELAERTKNFSGAEIEGLVKSAASFAFNRLVDPEDMSKQVDESKLTVSMADFLQALDEVHPAFGVSDDTLSRFLRNDAIEYDTFNKLIEHGDARVKVVRESERTPRMAVLFHGARGVGKSFIAAHLAMKSGFPFVQVVTAEDMVGVSELGRTNIINKTFEDAYKSPFSVVIVDNVERLIDYVPSSPVRYSSPVLNALMTLIPKVPPVGHKLLVLGTTSQLTDMRGLGLADAFDEAVEVPMLSSGDVVSVLRDLQAFDDEGDFAEIGSGLTRPIAIKHLYDVLEMVRCSDDDGVSIATRLVDALV